MENFSLETKGGSSVSVPVKFEHLKQQLFFFRFSLAVTCSSCAIFVFQVVTCSVIFVFPVLCCHGVDVFFAPNCIVLLDGYCIF